MLQIQIHPSNPFMSMNNKQSSVIQNEAPQDNRKTKLQFDLEPTKNLSKRQNQSKNPSEVKQSTEALIFSNPQRSNETSQKSQKVWKTYENGHET